MKLTRVLWVVSRTFLGCCGWLLSVAMWLLGVFFIYRSGSKDSCVLKSLDLLVCRNGLLLWDFHLFYLPACEKCLITWKRFEESFILKFRILNICKSDACLSKHHESAHFRCITISNDVHFSVLFSVLLKRLLFMDIKYFKGIQYANCMWCFLTIDCMLLAVTQKCIVKMYIKCNYLIFRVLSDILMGLSAYFCS